MLEFQEIMTVFQVSQYSWHLPSLFLAIFLDIWLFLGIWHQILRKPSTFVCILIFVYWLHLATYADGPSLLQIPSSVAALEWFPGCHAGEAV